MQQTCSCRLPWHPNLMHRVTKPVLFAALIVLLAAPPAHAQEEIPDSIRALLREASTGTVYVTQIRSAEEDTIQLEEGAAFAVRSPSYVAYLGYGTRAIVMAFSDYHATMFVDGSKIEGRLIRRPRSGGTKGRLTRVTGVRADGEVIELFNEGLFEVTSGYADMWEFARVILLDNGRVLRLDYPAELWVIPL